MNVETTQRLAQLANQLAENLMTVAICAEELRATIRAEADAAGAVGRARVSCLRSPGATAAHERPLVDPSTLSLSWDGKTCHLGYTILFRLADRLSRRPNQYLTFEQLLRDVWGGDHRSPDTIRSTVRNLRERLSLAGMNELAAAIHGQGGRYGLILNNGD